MNFPQARRANVRINFGGADVRVAEQFLDDPQVRSIFQQMSGETMPQHVRGNVAREIGPARPASDAQP